MEHTSDVPGITHVVTHRHDDSKCDLLSIYVHHELEPDTIDRIMRALELMVPGLIKLAATL